jgi:hypothetical protein
MDAVLLRKLTLSTDISVPCCMVQNWKNFKIKPTTNMHNCKALLSNKKDLISKAESLQSQILTQKIPHPVTRPQYKSEERSAIKGKAEK